MPSVELACGEGSQKLTLPETLSWARWEARQTATPPWRERLTQLLEPALAAVRPTLRAPGRRIVVLLPDETRRLPRAEMASPLLEALEAESVPASAVLFLIAGGVHRATASGALADVVRKRGARLAVHEARVAGRVVGTTTSGTAVELDAAYVEADLRIALGGVGFHYFAGFGGGPKLVFPGVASWQGVLANHRRSLGPWPPGGLEAGCGPGRLQGNPVAEEIREASSFLPPEIALHAVETASGWRLFEGAAGLEAARQAVCEAGVGGVAAQADCVVASAGGTPHDIDLVQSHKALFHAAAYCRPGGAILLVAAAERGSGSPALERWLAVPELETLESKARAAYDLNAQTAISLRRLSKGYRVFWLGSRSPEWILRAGAVVPGSEAEAWQGAETAARRTGAWTRGVLLPRAPVVLPQPAA